MLTKNKISSIPLIDDTNGRKINVPFKPSKPLPEHMGLLVCGKPKSGKTTLVTSLILSKKTNKHKDHHRYYYKYFDNAYIVSGSLDTLPIDLFDLPPSNVYDHYNEEVMHDILNKVHEDENGNYLIWLDDVVDDLKLNKTLTRAILNRRHVCQNKKEDKTRSTLSIIVNTQKFNCFPLRYRSNLSHFAVFPTINGKELACIKEELLGGLTKKQHDGLLDLCWSRPYGFLWVDSDAQPDKRYYSNFDLIDIKSL